MLIPDLDGARRHADAIQAQSQFARGVQQAHCLLAIMTTHQRGLNQVLATSHETVRESRALLLELD